MPDGPGDDGRAGKYGHIGKFLGQNTEIFKDLSVKKSELKFTKSGQDKQSSGDCLSCHFVATGNSLLPEQFLFHFENYTQEVKTMISVQEKIWSQTKFTFQLRGPPTIS